MAENMVSVTCTGPVNIAVVKYWGKRDENLILPVNSSLSATLHQEQLRAKTTVAASRTFTRDRMWLNGTEQSVEAQRIQNVLSEIRRRARKRHADDEDGLPILDWRVHICSENNFPTAAGLASSAAGFACLVYTLAKLYGVHGDLSEIARQGSGSACRSVYGGFVAWDMGSTDDGSDSIARQVVPEDHWSELRILVLVVNAGKKHIGSTSGMQNSVNTSELLKHRTKHSVPERMHTITKAIHDKDFQVFAEETMKDSNQMHAVCMDTYPPVFYMTDTSRDIIRMVHAINDYYGEAKVCYTFDAGPNACLYMPESSVSMVYSVIKHFYVDSNTNGCFVRGLPMDTCKLEQSFLDSVPLTRRPGGLQYVISTRVGPGPQVLQDTDSLLDNSGMPKVLQ